MTIVKNFVVLEGADGSGTTTQIEKLKVYLKMSSKFNGDKPVSSFFCTFEPTDGPIGGMIRSILKEKTKVTPQTLAYLFAADRNEHIYGSNGIINRCKRGELVICDRFTLSSLVYQGISCGETLPELLNKDFPKPELLFYLDIDSETAQKRMEDRPEKEIFEGLDFQKRVRDRYLTILPSLESQGVKTERIDASRSADEVAARIWEIMQKMPIFNSGETSKT